MDEIRDDEEIVEPDMDELKKKEGIPPLEELDEDVDSIDELAEAEDDDDDLEFEDHEADEE